MPAKKKALPSAKSKQAKPDKQSKQSKQSKQAKQAKQAAKQREAEIDQSVVGSWIECASSAADAMRERARARIEKLESDVRFAQLARDVWFEHRDLAPQIAPVFERYLAVVSAQTKALASIVDELAQLAELPEAQDRKSVV